MTTVKQYISLLKSQKLLINKLYVVFKFIYMECIQIIDNAALYFINNCD